MWFSGEIEANEALLTGESDLIVKKENDKLFSGSYVTSGKCYAIIEKVGEDNFANKIISSAKKQKSNQSELILSMKKITRFTSFVIIPFGIILFVQCLLYKTNRYYTSSYWYGSSITWYASKRISIINYNFFRVRSY